MAKRRKLEAPSAQDLSRLEEEFRRETTAETPRAPLSVPIAQVAAEAASGYQSRSVEERAVLARDQADATRLRDAEGRGLVMLEIPLDDIDPEALVRDRVVLDAEEMQELQSSIATNGLRLPIEVFELPDTEAGSYRYGLLSGYRRLRAVQALKALNSRNAAHHRIKAVLRDPEAMGGTFAAMIEENEIRASLSHFERGRIAVIASQQGAFVNVEAAVDELFPMASKAKRSKIRSFALIFEELGDMLAFPDLLREKEGLQLAAALRNGAEGALREALACKAAQTPEEETEMLSAALAELTPVELDRRRGGRPKKVADTRTRSLQGGGVLEYGQDGKGWTIRLKGRALEPEVIELAVSELERLLADR